MSEQDRLYTCDLCDYRTTKLGNFQRHTTSNTHINRVSFAELNDFEFEPQPQLEVEQASAMDDVQRLLSVDVRGNYACIDEDEDENTTRINDGFEDIEVQDCDFSMNGDDEEEEISTTDHNVEEKSCGEWFPFSSKVHLLLSVLYCSKTHRISDETMSFVMFIMKECGISVPPLSNIKSFLQKNLDLEDMLQRHEDTNGNVCWIVKPSSMLKLQMANPQISDKISRYPTVQNSDQSVHQASGDKWKEMNFCWAKNKNGQQFVKGKFVEFEVRGRQVYGKLMKFLENLEEEKLYAKVEVFIDRRDSMLGNQNNQENCLVRIKKTYTLDLIRCTPFDTSNVTFMGYNNGAVVALDEEDISDVLRVTPLWKGLPVVNVPLNIFMDDLSANVSRRWSPVHSVQGQISGLPLDEKNKGKNVMFFGLSQNLPMLELVKPICKDIEDCKQLGTIAYDATLKQNVILTTEISLIVSDFQMMSLVCNHMGPAAKKFCPKCFADASNSSFASDARKKEQTLRTLTRLEIHHDKSALQKETGVKLYENCLWDYIDCHKEAPIGMLHFLYLGLAKQILKFTFQSLNEDKKRMLTIHLVSIDQSGFSFKVQDTFFKFIDSRQGKDYKHYLQIAALNMEYAGLQPRLVKAIVKLAMISKHVLQRYSTETISAEIEDYFNYLKSTIPELARKPKAHLCVHLSEDMKRHGHPLQYIEDGFEKNHKSIRGGIKHQNGHARSRDTAVQFINNELMKHVISGGFVPDGDVWKSASDNVLAYQQNSNILSFLGIPEDQVEQEGKLKFMDRTKQMVSNNDLVNVYILQAVLMCGGSPSTIEREDFLVRHYKGLALASSGIIAKVESFIAYMNEDGNDKLGCIIDLCDMKWRGNYHQFVVVKKVSPVPATNSFQKVKVEEEVACLKVDSIKEAVHVVHDCHGGSCVVRKGQRLTRQEQEEVSVEATFLKHSLHNLYFINKCRIVHSVDKFTV